MYRTKQPFLGKNNAIQALVGGFGLVSVYINVRKDEGKVAKRSVRMKEASMGAYRVSYDSQHFCVPSFFVCSIDTFCSSYLLACMTQSFFPHYLHFFTFVVWLTVLMASSLVLFLSSASPDFISGNSLICTYSKT
ncbi:hypothetical protein RYX36_034061 [Vicia faba]